MRGTLRMPKAMVTASKARSGNGSASALPSTNVTTSSSPRSAARARPTSSMAWLMSATVTRVRVVAGVHHPEGDVAGAAGDVEQRERPVACLRRPDGFWRIRRHQHVLPGAVQAGRHQVVHQVVAARDRMEHVVDQRLLVAKRHVAVAEMGVLGHAILRKRFAGGTIARAWRGGYVRAADAVNQMRIRVDLSRPRTT